MLVVTHDDPLSLDEVRAAAAAMANKSGADGVAAASGAMTASALRAQIARLDEQAKAFFAHAERLVIAGGSRSLAAQRVDFARLYPHDHLRFVARQAAARLHFEFNATRASNGVYDFRLRAHEFDACEYLTAASIVRDYNAAAVESYTMASRAASFDLLNFEPFPTTSGEGKATDESKRAATTADNEPRMRTEPDFCFEVSEAQTFAQLVRRRRCR